MTSGKLPNPSVLQFLRKVLPYRVSVGFRLVDVRSSGRLVAAVRVMVCLNHKKNLGSGIAEEERRARGEKR